MLHPGYKIPYFNLATALRIPATATIEDLDSVSALEEALARG